ncbi:TAP-like protein [Streptomyces sp. cf386]|uniref:alpha/beta fold hydrolase n=1 Tax=Streptomyces sp. cf386 TaxID=1761904 RepID=UPI0008919A14|nr:alpha/beta fold hydrolase [Streptomyces sp. cf386]SDP09401.1 TAP-like protein [Streptomyces sp. cf386]
MQPLFRALTGVLAAGLLAGLLTGVATPGVEAADAGPPGDGSSPQESIDWTPCPQDATAECGTLRLPVDWSDPSAETFGLAVARRKAADPARRVGTLLVNPGGPGASGVSFAVRDAKSHFSEDILERFDIVGFDPRGVGGSHPVRCSTELLDRRPSPYPRNQAQFDRLAEYNRTLAEDCRRHTGPLFDHADTLSVVRDMDALRAALGEEKINYFGHSYGTLIGEQYAEEYGGRIRSMALTANIDHSLGTREFLVSSAAAAEDSFHQFVQWCDRTSSCALHGRDVTAVWNELLARADRGEIHDPERPDQILTGDAIRLAAFMELYGPDPDELAAYVAGLDAQNPNERRGSGQPRQAKPSAAQEPRPSAAAEPQTKADPFAAVFCQDWSIRPKDYREYAKLAQAELRAAPHMRDSPRIHDGVARCIGMPDEVNNPQHRLRITEAPKILMLHARHDPANHFTWAANVHRQTRGTTVLLPYEGTGHSVYGRSDCTRDAVDDYLTELRLPRAGSSCAPAGTD